jgi:VanZ family protein
MEVTRTRRSALALAVLWAPPIALMAVIFVLSAQPDLNSGLGTLDTILRKLAHMAEYGLLVFLLWRALRASVPDRPAVAVALALGVLYAVSDEWHQSFVEGRHGTPVDVLIDSVGMAAVAAVLLRRLR